MGDGGLGVFGRAEIFGECLPFLAGAGVVAEVGDDGLTILAEQATEVVAA